MITSEDVRGARANCSASPVRSAGRALRPLSHGRQPAPSGRWRLGAAPRSRERRGGSPRVRAAPRGARSARRSVPIGAVPSTAQRATSCTRPAMPTPCASSELRVSSIDGHAPLERPPRASSVARAAVRPICAARFSGGGPSRCCAPHLELRTASRASASFLPEVACCGRHRARRGRAIARTRSRTRRAGRRSSRCSRRWERRGGSRARGARGGRRDERAGESARQRRPRQPGANEPWPHNSSSRRSSVSPPTSGSSSFRRPSRKPQSP